MMRLLALPGMAVLTLLGRLHAALLFYPAPGIVRTPADIGLGYRDVALRRR